MIASEGRTQDFGRAASNKTGFTKTKSIQVNNFILTDFIIAQEKYKTILNSRQLCTASLQDFLPGSERALLRNLIQNEFMQPCPK